MNENKEMFSQEAIDGARHYLESEGILKLQEKEETNNQDSISKKPDVQNEL